MAHLRPHVSARPKVVVLGTMCHLPLAGMVWLFLHYLLGLERLGYETYYVEWHGRWVGDPENGSRDTELPRVMVGEVMERHGLGERWICRADHLGPGRTFGKLAADALPGLYAEAVAVINVTGSHHLEPEMMRCRRRVYLETDPGIPQVRLKQGHDGMRALVDAHTHHFTWAQNIDGNDCALPATHLAYGVTRQPVVLDLWNSRMNDSGRRFTTIARWSKRGKDVKVGEESYRWSKDFAFRRVIHLPERADTEFELALTEICDDDRDELRLCGWSVVDAGSISASVDAYCGYVQGSRGEFTIAKDQYVRFRTGWFSDRSACYLAAGRPVITEDTGFSATIPCGEGVFAFRTLDDAVAAVEAVESDHARHRRAAMEIAREYFSHDRVLGKLLSDIGVG